MLILIGEILCLNVYSQTPAFEFQTFERAQCPLGSDKKSIMSQLV